MTPETPRPETLSTLAPREIVTARYEHERATARRLARIARHNRRRRSE